MADARIRAVITAEDRASGVIKNFSNTSMAALGAIAGVAQAVTSKAIDAISDSVGTAIKRVDTLNNSTRVFANMGFAAGDVKTSMDALKTSILGLPTPLDSAVRGMQMIASSTGDIKKSQQVFSALNDAIIGFGGSADMVENSVLQLSQAFSNGRIDAQTWNSMMQSGLGPTLNAIAKQMNITTGALKDGLSSGNISVKQFQDALVTLDTKGGGGLKSLQQIAHDATAGIGTGIENAKTAIARGMANILQSIGSENISKAITSIGDFFEKLLTKVSFVMPKIMAYLTPLFGRFQEWAVSVWPTVKRAWDEFIATMRDWVIPFVKAAAKAIEELAARYPLLAQLGLVMAGLAVIFAVNPIVAFAIAAIGAITLLHQYWDSISQFFVAKWTEVKTFFDTNPIGEGVKNDILSSFKTISDSIGPILNGIKVFWQDNKDTIIADAKIIAGAIIVAFALVAKTIAAVVSAMAQMADFYAKNKDVFRAITAFATMGVSEVPNLLHKLHVPGFASGVQNFGGGMAVVGEKGPELVQLPRGSNVIPNSQLGGAGQTTVNISLNVGVYAGSEIEKRKLAQSLFSSLQEVANQKNTTVAQMMGA